jgi:phosphoribosylaminoimidazolecarboxamide formyltransferase / IMP cyclohydrolase
MNSNTASETFPMLRPIRRALLSVSDKTGLVELAQELHTRYQVELIATGGTKKTLSDAGLPVRDVSELTLFPEILDGRVKTLHPGVFAGLLARRDNPAHMSTLQAENLPEIDLVICNLYPFELTVAKPDVTEAQAIETIDIGGPSMVRAAAKNYASVAVLVNPESYPEFLSELQANAGQTSLTFRRGLASAAFIRIAEYDAAIADYFLNSHKSEESDGIWESEIDLPFNLKQTLRYGENPHQPAAFYVEPDVRHACVATAKQLHGRELSYNNILDLDSALNMVREFDEPAAVVVKHNNPCGAAIAPTLDQAFLHAWQGDPLAAFGGILAFNRPVDMATADALCNEKRFVECIIAPDFAPEAFELLTTKPSWKKNVRLLKTGELTGYAQGLDYRRVDGGLLVQARDIEADDPSKWETVTTRKATDEELAALWFNWLICKHVKSNAIVLGGPAGAGANLMVFGVGAGQMSRVDSVQIAIRKAGEHAKGSVLASDAFFPFPDNVEAAAAAGITAIVQPGGSQNDQLSIDACNQHGIAMMFTKVRHFRH